MIKIVDARGGEMPRIGETVRYTDGHWWKLLQVEDRFFSARALVDSPAGLQWVPLRVRFMHPSFMFQRVGFFPS